MARSPSFFRSVGLTRGEWLDILPLTATHALLMAALYVLKPARNAVFLDRFDAAQLPYVMLLVALLATLTAVLYAWCASRVRIDRLAKASFAVFALVVLAFRVFIPLGYDWVYYAFYVWVSLYGAVAISMVWQVANLRFHAREARRLFGVLGTGGSVGAIGGGMVTSGMAPLVGTDNMLVAAATLILACILFVQPGGEVARAQDLDKGGSTWASVKESRLIQWLAVVVALAAVIAVIVDIQFNDVVDNTFATKDDKTAFFGQFFAGLSALAVLIQLFVTSRVLGRLGVGTALMVLPMALGLGTAGMLVLPGLASASALKASEGSIRHSLHKASTEIVMIPVPPLLKRRAKFFLDATVDALATGAGALLVLFLTRRLQMSYVHLGFVSLLLLGLWFWASTKLRAAYIDAFRRALAGRSIELNEIRTNIAEGASLDAVLHTLEGNNAKQLQYVLDMVAPVRDRRLVEPLRALLRHPSPQVRARAVHALRAQVTDSRAEVEPMLDDDDYLVRVEAAYYLCRNDSAGGEPTLRRLLASEDPRSRAAALGRIANYGTEQIHELVTPELLSYMSIASQTEEGEQIRSHLAKLLAKLPVDEFRPYWESLMEDTSERVVQETIQSVGRARDPAHMEWLFDLLADHRYRMEARLSLAEFGPQVLPELDRRLSETTAPKAVRDVLPRILSRIHSQQAVEILLKHLVRADASDRAPLITALRKLRARFTDLTFGRQVALRLLAQEISTYYLLDQALFALNADNEAQSVLESRPSLQRGDALLIRAISERKEEVVGNIMNLLSLDYPPQDIQSAAYAILRGRSTERADALELLENLLTREIKEQVLPILDPERQEQRAEASLRVLGRSIGSRHTALTELADVRDSWLRACVIHALQPGEPGFAELLQRAAADRNPVVAETAERKRMDVNPC